MVEPTRIGKHLIAYGSEKGFSDETVNFITSHFDVLDCSFYPGAVSSFERLKTKNPSLIILVYRGVMVMRPYYDDWEEVNSHEDWFLHDINGNRLVHSYWGWYAMDVGNVGWRSHYANWVKNWLDNYTIDGIFADDVWEWTNWHYGVWNVPAEYISKEIGERWHNDMLEMIRFVKATIGKKLLIVNTPNRSDYVDACDGKMEENFVHPSWWDLDEFHDDPINWKGRVESLKSISQSGKYFLAQGGTIIPENPTESDLQEVHNMMLYCFASYLLGVNGEKATFGFNNIYSEDGSRGYYTEFDVSLGSPVNEYYSIDSVIDSVYARDFTDGKVLVNPTQSIHTVDLDGQYKTIDDQRVSNVTLAPHSGIILFRA